MKWAETLARPVFHLSPTYPYRPSPIQRLGSICRCINTPPNPNRPFDLHTPSLSLPPSLPSDPPLLIRQGLDLRSCPFSSGKPHHFVARCRRRRRVGVGSLPFPIPGCSTLLETGSFLLLAPSAPFLSPSPPQICSWRALRELRTGRPYGRGGRALRIGRSPSPVALSPRMSSFLLRRGVALDARRGRRGGPVCGRAALDARRGLCVGRPPRRGGLLDARQGGHAACDSPMGKQVAAVEEVESRGKPWRSHLLSWPPPRVVAASSSDCPQPSGGRKRLRCLLPVNGTMVPVSGFLVVNFVAQLVR